MQFASGWILRQPQAGALLASLSPSSPTSWLPVSTLVFLVTRKLASSQHSCLPRQPQPGLLLAFLQESFLPPSNTASPGVSF